MTGFDINSMAKFCAVFPQRRQIRGEVGRRRVGVRPARTGCVSESARRRDGHLHAMSARGASVAVRPQSARHQVRRARRELCEAAAMHAMRLGQRNGEPATGAEGGTVSVRVFQLEIW
jgi:hypothetical protein